MKNLTVIFIIFLLLMAGCGVNRKSDDLITVDVTANYPQIELNLQDFMDVEYIADSRILTELSSDTIFRLFPDYRMTPFMIRTPPIHSMNPEIFLLPEILTDRYYFLEILKKEVEARPGFFPRTKLVYDKQEKATYRYTVYNDDYSSKKPLEFTAFSSSHEIAFRQKLEAHELIDLNRKGELKGKLKEVASELDDDSNPVIMLVKYKK